MLEERLLTSNVVWMSTRRCACSLGVRWGRGCISSWSMSRMTSPREKPSSSDLPAIE